MATKNTSLSRITIDIPKADHKRLKTLAAMMGTTMRELIVQSIEDRLCCADSQINKETVKAIENIEKGKGLTKYKNSQDLFKKLGI